MNDDAPPGIESPRAVRLFVAIELPAALRDALAAASALLRDAGATEGLRWARSEGTHLTLKFLGSTPSERVRDVCAALDGLATGVAPFELQPAGFGSFHGGPGVVRGHADREPTHRNLQVLWVGVDGDTTALHALAAAVASALAPLGFVDEKRAFFPHLTLARRTERADTATRERLFRALEPFLSRSTSTEKHRPELVPTFPPLPVERIALMESTSMPGGAVYRALDSFALRG